MQSTHAWQGGFPPPVLHHFCVFLFPTRSSSVFSRDGFHPFLSFHLFSIRFTSISVLFSPHLLLCPPGSAQTGVLWQVQLITIAVTKVVQVTLLFKRPPYANPMVLEIAKAVSLTGLAGAFFRRYGVQEDLLPATFKMICCVCLFITICFIWQQRLKIIKARLTVEFRSHWSRFRSTQGTRGSMVRWIERREADLGHTKVPQTAFDRSVAQRVPVDAQVYRYLRFKFIRYSRRFWRFVPKWHFLQLSKQ